MTLLENISGDVLIGLRKQEESNRYVWQSNEEVKFTYWANWEPTSYVRHICIIHTQNKYRYACAQIKHVERCIQFIFTIIL